MELSRSIMTIVPPHCGQVQSEQGDESAFSCEPVSAETELESASSWKQSGSNVPRVLPEATTADLA
jgi:hypothetical protein